MKTAPIQVLHVAAEIFPLVKTGGLADVVSALPQALLDAGAGARLLLPGLPAILDGLDTHTLVCELGALFGAGRVSLRLGRLAHSGVLAYVVDAPYLYQRAGGPYQDSDGQEWCDNLQRFALLGWVGAHLGAGELDGNWAPDVVHAHDWHAALACAYGANHPGLSAPSIFTIHNLAYQGLYPATDFHLLGLPSRFIVSGGFEFHGQLSFMKAGLKFAHRVTTVSPNYAREIATHEFGCGLEGVIRARGSHVSGILNGVDGTIWNPAHDAAIAAPYDARKLAGKAHCKAALQSELGLQAQPSAPVFGLVSRLTEQKGLDMVLSCLPALLAHPLQPQLVVQGSGDAALEAAFDSAAAAHPGRVAVRHEFNEPLAHRVIAGADAMLVPSRFEPCGLTQLYALRYGTVPLVRSVGGLADTVVDATPAALQSDSATGFRFDAATPQALTQALERTLASYAQAAQWRQLMLRGMAQNFSWKQSAARYMDLYAEVCA